MTSEKEALNQLIHDINSKCASLKSAADLLKKASPAERKEFLTLMTQQAQSLVQNISSFERSNF